MMVTHLHSQRLGSFVSERFLPQGIGGIKLVTMVPQGYWQSDHAYDTNKTDPDMTGVVHQLDSMSQGQLHHRRSYTHAQEVASLR